MTRHHSFSRLLLAVTIAMVLSACTTSSPSSTVVSSSKKLNEPQGQYKELIALAVTSNRDYRTTIEHTLAEKLIDRGFQVSRINDDELPWRDADKMTRKVSNLANRAGADGVLVVTLVRQEDEKGYVPMQVEQKPMVVGVGAHAQTYMDTTVAPGYYQDRKSYVLKTTLFDTQSGKPVWQLYSNTVNPRSLEDGARDYAVAVAEVLSEDVGPNE